MEQEQFTTRYEICVGFNDGDTREQKFSEELYEKIIINVCRGYRISYSINKLSGGYIHEDGTFVKENSASIILIGVSEQQVEEIAKDLCVFFHQESVLIMKSTVSYRFLSEQL